MQGYILNIFAVRDEDTIVYVLTPHKLKTLYRFYGARHSTIQTGYKIDFEAVSNAKSKLPLLRGVSHLGYEWLYDYNKAYFWQSYIKLFYNHLKGIEDIDSFYYELLEKDSYRWEKQNPKRIIVESYVKILEHEGRLHKDYRCFVCEGKIRGEAALVRGFLPAHQECVAGRIFDKWRLDELFENKSTLYFNDEQIDLLYNIVSEGF